MILEGVILVITVILLQHLIFRLREPSGLPPGPPPLPLLGNIYNIFHYLPQTHLAFNEIAKKYGSIFTVYLQSQRVVVINSVSAVREALITKKDDFSGRPPSFTGNIFSRGSKGIGFTDFTSTLVLQRKIAHSALRMYSPKLEEKIIMEVDEMIKRFKEKESESFSPRTDISLLSMNIICAVVFGERYEIDDEEFLEIAENNYLANLVIAGTLDLFPWLIHFPVKHTKALHQLITSRDRILNRKYKEHEDTYEEGMIRDLTDALLKAKLEEEKLDSSTKQMMQTDNVIMTMQDVIVAGQETTTTTMLWLITYLARYPEIQAKVHAELDQVVGRERVPVLCDRAQLHYLQATIAETLRYSSLVPLLLPHKTTCDTSLEGYFIPKDTMIFVNNWALNHDKEFWDNPDDFDPSRFLDEKGHFTTHNNMAYLPFGAGRRVCVGESMAKQVVFLVMSKILHRFQIKRVPNFDLKDLDGNGGIVNVIKYFEVLIEDRHK